MDGFEPVRTPLSGLFILWPGVSRADLPASSTLEDSMVHVTHECTVDSDLTVCLSVNTLRSL